LGVPRKILWKARTKAAAPIKAPTDAKKVSQGEAAEGGEEDQDLAGEIAEAGQAGGGERWP
jgi:hypothetical protein